MLFPSLPYDASVACPVPVLILKKSVGRMIEIGESSFPQIFRAEGMAQEVYKYLFICFVNKGQS